MIFISVLMSFSVFAESRTVFISFSMPEKLLIETLQESAHLQIPAILNGLVENSFEKTIERVVVLTNVVPNLQLQIDPTQFERFNIKQVPALVVENNHCFDVIYGNLPLHEGLLRIYEKGECGKRGGL